VTVELKGQSDFETTSQPLTSGNILKLGSL
jgi:hypothetical protein